MARIVRFAATALCLLIAVVVLRALSVPSRQITVEPAPEAAIDNLAVLGRFTGALRYKTISHGLEVAPEAEAFLGLHDYLARQFPLVHEHLYRETVNQYSLLFTWQGREPQRKPLILAAHLDVVPIEPGTEDEWTHPPFEGRIADGFVWGRGTLDDKFGVLAILEAVEHLLQQDFQPQATIYLAFGHDEELGGPNGAAQMAKRLAARGIEAELVLDEGGSLIEAGLPGIDRLIACVGIAEKGSVSVEVTARTEGGHSSSPPRHTAVGLIGTAVHDLERNPMPASIRGGALRSFIDHVAPEMALPYRAVFSNLWLFAPVIRTAFQTNPAANASMRTTTAVTMISGGVKENVLPSSARAVVNFRTLPGDTQADVLAHVRRVVSDSHFEVTVVEGAREASPQSPIDGRGFEMVARSIRAVYPGAVVAPYLTIGGTDARHYAIVSRHIYRFSPLIGNSSDLKRIHGTDERTAVEHYQQAIQFFVALLRQA